MISRIARAISHLRQRRQFARQTRVYREWLAYYQSVGVDLSNDAYLHAKKAYFAAAGA